jgi:hypothetical protein
MTRRGHLLTGELLAHWRRRFRRNHPTHSLGYLRLFVTGRRQKNLAPTARFVHPFRGG